MAIKNICSTHILKMNANNFVIGIKIEDSLRSFVRTSKKMYSFYNKTDLTNFFNDFVRYSAITINSLKEFNLVNEIALANIILDKKEVLEKEGWKFNCIKKTHTDLFKEELEKWIKQGKPIIGHTIKREDYKNIDYSDLKRELVIYNVDDPENPETTFSYPYYGARGGKSLNGKGHNDHQEHLCAGDWAINTGLNYYNARGILLENYLKKTGIELKNDNIIYED